MLMNKIAMKMVLVLNCLADGFRERFLDAAGGKYEVVFEAPGWSRETLLSYYAHADIILGEPDSEDLKFCKNLSLLLTSWAGVDNYIATGMFDTGRILCNGSGGYGPVIAEYTVGMILALCHRLPAYQRFQRQGIWRRQHSHRTLEGATVLILGAGDIGTEIAKRLKPFRCRCVGVRRTDRPCPDEFNEMIILEELDQWLPRADVVACSLPSTPCTRGLLDERRLRLMRSDAILANVGRGDLIVTDDLVRVMKAGHLWGAVLDVTSPEPLPENHPLWQMENVILTPHVSGSCVADNSPTKARLSEIMVSNFENYVKGKPLCNVVDCEQGY